MYVEIRNLLSANFLDTHLVNQVQNHPANTIIKLYLIGIISPTNYIFYELFQATFFRI